MKIIYTVDDESQFTEMMEAILSDKYKVRRFNSGEKLFDKLKEEIPDLILLDILMPDVDGYEVMEKLNSNDLYKNIPIIVISSIHTLEERAKAHRLGAVDYITKPVKTPDLLLSISHALNN